MAMKDSLAYLRTPEAIRERTGQGTLEDAFVQLIGTGEGLA